MEVEAANVEALPEALMKGASNLLALQTCRHLLLFLLLSHRRKGRGGFCAYVSITAPLSLSSLPFMFFF